MAKKRQRVEHKPTPVAETVPQQQTLDPQTDESLGRFVAPPCTLCTALDSPNRRTTYINGTELKLNSDVELIISRVIKCRRCGNTWTDYERIKHKVS